MISALKLELRYLLLDFILRLSFEYAPAIGALVRPAKIREKRLKAYWNPKEIIPRMWRLATTGTDYFQNFNNGRPGKIHNDNNKKDKTHIKSHTWTKVKSVDNQPNKS
jgi:hypothetical protein